MRLTEAGRALVDEVAVAHLETEHELLGGLSVRQRSDLASLLRAVLVDLGDVPDR